MEVAAVLGNVFPSVLLHEINGIVYQRMLRESKRNSNARKLKTVN